MLQEPTISQPIRMIAVDLDGTLLTSDKEFSSANRMALERAAAAGIEIVPTTGRLYDAIPAAIRALAFIRYVITVNGAEVTDLKTGETIHKAEIPRQQAIEIMKRLDEHPVIYDCYQDNEAWMTAAQKLHIDRMVRSSHYRKMLHELRKPVPELKAFLSERNQDVQKVQFFTDRSDIRLQLLQQLPHWFNELCVSSSVADNVEINQIHANKGEALLALAAHLGVRREQIAAFGDGLNDLSMLQAAGIGIAMENACDAVKAVADRITGTCDADGVAYGIDRFCLNI